MRRCALFGHVSGDPLLDLVNTVDWRLSDELREERLPTYAHVLRWCLESGLLTDEEHERCRVLAKEDPTSAESEREAVIELREATYEALVESDADAAAVVADAYRAAIDAAELTTEGNAWSWATATSGLEMPRHRIALGLMDLLRRDDLDRLHQCEDEACGWVFLDTSPRRNRRWCSTSDCGDRNRSRAYYARHKAERRP